MNEVPNSKADADVADALESLQKIQKVFAKTPAYDLPFCTPVSHVLDYQCDEKRLRKYGADVIGTRSFHFALLTAIKAYWNIKMYLDGIATANPFALPAAARAQIELFALAWHVYDVVLANGGFNRPDLAKRMLAVDEAFIMAIHGTRSGEIIDLYNSEQLSNLRPTTPRDLDIFKAKNILTRIQKAGGGSGYQTCSDDYDHLSDLVHPNGMQNLLLMTQSPRGMGWFHLALGAPQQIRRAQYQSIHAMLNASSEILRLVSEVPDPFGPPNLHTKA